MEVEVAVALIGAGSTLIGAGMKSYFDYKKLKLEKTIKPIGHEDYKPKLVTHSVFNRLDMYLSQVQTTFSLENKGKEEVFRCLLTKKLEIGKTCLTDMCKILDKALTEKTMESEELYNLCKDSLEVNLRNMETFFYSSQEFTSDEIKCLSIVNRKFYCWHYPRVQYMKETIYNICCCSLFYKDSYTKVVSILDAYCSVYADLLNDAQKTLNSLNGDLEGLKFKTYIL